MIEIQLTASVPEDTAVYKGSSSPDNIKKYLLQQPLPSSSQRAILFSSFVFCKLCCLFRSASMLSLYPIGFVAFFFNSALIRSRSAIASFFARVKDK